MCLTSEIDSDMNDGKLVFEFLMNFSLEWENKIATVCWISVKSSLFELLIKMFDGFDGCTNRSKFYLPLSAICNRIMEKNIENLFPRVQNTFFIDTLSVPFVITSCDALEILKLSPLLESAKSRLQIPHKTNRFGAWISSANKIGKKFYETLILWTTKFYTFYFLCPAERKPHRSITVPRRERRGEARKTIFIIPKLIPLHKINWVKNFSFLSWIHLSYVSTITVQLCQFCFKV